MQKIISLFIVILLMIVAPARAEIGAWQYQDDAAKVRVLGSYLNISGDERGKAILAVEFILKDGWKIYGNMPGSFVMPPKFDFKSSKNYRAHSAIWPEPILESEKIVDNLVKYFVYRDRVIIPIEIITNLAQEDLDIKLQMDYGICKDICIPAYQEFDLKIKSGQIDEKALKIIQEFYPKPISKQDQPNYNFDQQKNRISLILFFAVIGGAILNIMPCVLPVLSIKLLSIINHSDSSIQRVRFAFVSTIIGILFCFIVFSAIASLIKLTGNALGWGLQFQNPYFLTALMVILVFFTTNLLGVFDINFSGKIANLLVKNSDRSKAHIFWPNFLSGILAVTLATPCSAPFLGSAISFALTDSYSNIFLIFFAIGIGFSLPYIILLFAPKLVYLLPKPGPWMIKFRQVMAGFLMATLIWIIYVLIGNIGFLPAMSIAVFSMLLVGALKIKIKYFRRVTIVLLLIGIFSMPFELYQKQSAIYSYRNDFWYSFDETKISHYLAKNQLVVVDVTANWCITCKFNKIRVLEDEEVMKILKSGDIISMRADITRPKPEVMEFLKKHNRYAIPFNVIYSPLYPNGLVTKEILQKDEFIELIRKARYGEKYQDHQL